MKLRLLAVSIACFAALLSSQATASLMTMSGTLPHLVDQADVICAGTVGEVQAGERAEFETGIAPERGLSRKIPATKAVARFTVDDFLKGGGAEPEINVSFPQSLPDAVLRDLSIKGLLFTKLEPGERVLLFLHSDAAKKAGNDGDDKAAFSLIHPAVYNHAKIAVGQATVKDMPQEATPLRRVLLYLAAALTSEEMGIQRACLYRLSQAGGLLYTPYRGDSMLRQSLGERSRAFEEFVKIRILPAVMALVDAPDESLRDLAFTTAAALQNEEAIPQMVQLTRRKNSIAIYRIGLFRAPSGVKFLIPILQDEPGLRDMAALALRGIGDRHALPFLLEHLDDPDPESYSIFAALYVITREKGWPSKEKFLEQRPHYVSFWKNWAAQHAEELTRLRREAL